MSYYMCTTYIVYLPNIVMYVYQISFCTSTEYHIVYPPDIKLHILLGIKLYVYQSSFAEFEISAQNRRNLTFNTKRTDF